MHRLLLAIVPFVAVLVVSGCGNDMTSGDAESDASIRDATPTADADVPDNGCGGVTTRLIAPTSSVAARHSHSAIWTGSEMIIWGGLGATNSLASGGRYDPTRNRWLTTATTSAPTARAGHPAIWTGREMIVWGGSSEAAVLAQGARYDPREDRWTEVSGLAEPTPRSGHSALWTGSEMIVWGGIAEGGDPQLSGARYDPDRDVWTSLPETGAPSARFGHTAIWTGEEMIIWGGYDSAMGGAALATGGVFDPSTNQWRAIAVTGAPSARGLHAAIWTGSEMIIWGGLDETRRQPVVSGGLYDPGSDRWRVMSNAGAASARAGFVAVWTSSEMIIHGGAANSLERTAFRYVPIEDEWSPIEIGVSSAARASHRAVWTGCEMLFWGGIGPTRFLDDGLILRLPAL